MVIIANHIFILSRMMRQAFSHHHNSIIMHISKNDYDHQLYP